MGAIERVSYSQHATPTALPQALGAAPTATSEFANELRRLFKTPESVEKLRQLRHVAPDDRESVFFTSFIDEIRTLILDAHESEDELDRILQCEVQAQFARIRFKDVSETRPHVRRIIRN